MSLEKIKEVKQLSSTNKYIGTPIGCDAENVDLADGSNLEEKLDDIDANIESVNNEVKEIQDSIQIDGVTITRDDATKVIALAKTLQDKIASVDSKINATNIANNLTTTEANFVLDARQGKTLQDQITSLNNDFGVKKYYGKLIATDLVRFRTELQQIYNAIYVFGNLVMISFSVILKSNIGGTEQYHIITLPDSLLGIEWNNLCGSFIYSRACPFVFSDNLNRVTLIVQNETVSAGDELRVWGIGFLV